MMMEPDHVEENPDSDLTSVTAVDDVRNCPHGVDDHGQELLAERRQAERASSPWRCQFRARLRPASVKLAAGYGYGYGQRRVRMALSGRTASPVTLTMRNDAGGTMRGAIRDAHCAGPNLVAHAEASQARWTMIAHTHEQPDQAPEHSMAGAQKGKFPVIGFVKNPTGVAALYLGKREGKDLVYMGKVGTGWSRTEPDQETA
jgi:hypothetical protein